MNKKTSAFVNSLVLISLALGGISAAEAQRLGGGTSFGSKQSYSAPVKRADLPPSNRIASPPVANRAVPNYQQPQQHYQPQQHQQQSNSDKWKDRAMGAAAGLAVGGLVGSMMSGSEEHPAAQSQQVAPPPPQPQQNYAQPAAPAPVPQQAPQVMEQPQQPAALAPAPVQPQQNYAQPAPMPLAAVQTANPVPYADNTGATKSGGIGFLGYLLLAGLGYLAYRFFFAKKTPSDTLSQPNFQRSVNEPAYSAPSASTGGSSADFNTDIMFKKGDSTVSLSKVNLAKSRETTIPAGFDAPAFLDEVKHRYMDLQRAWDARDLAEIRGLTTDKVFAEIQSQIKNSTETNNTDVLTLDADLLEIRELNSEFDAVVLFESMIREDAAGQENQVFEVWHFVKAKSGFNAKWMLDGIQQIED